MKGVGTKGKRKRLKVVVVVAREVQAVHHLLDLFRKSRTIKKIGIENLDLIQDLSLGVKMTKKNRVELTGI